MRRLNDLPFLPFWPACVAVLLGSLVWGCADEAKSTDGGDMGASDETDFDTDLDDTNDVEADADGEVSPLQIYCGDDYEAVEERIDVLIGALSLQQKAALMHGAFPLPAGGTWATTAFDDLGIPGFHMLDGPRGVSQVAGNATAFPVAMMRGATWDPDLEQRVGAMVGVEARAVGADVLLAPTMNVLRHPRWGRAQETYSEDPFLIGQLAVGFIRGAQQHVIATAKHYAANSIEDTRLEVDVQVDERTLREIYLPHFRRAVEDGPVGAVMCAYNQVNGFYASENEHLLRDILKGDWRFAGFVMSDWIWGVHSTVGAAQAGLDVEMPARQYFGPPVVNAVEGGELDESVVDEAVRRILRAQLCFELDADPAVPDASLIETREAYDLALESAQRGIVLLVNRDSTLPIDRDATSQIVVLGPLADVENIGDTGSSAVAPSEVVTAVEGIVARSGTATVTHVTGDPASDENAPIVAGADAVVVVVGLTADDEGEHFVGAGDRESMELPADQQTLIAQVASANDTVIVVLEGGSALVMNGWLDDVEALLMAWYPGVEGGHAIADVLFGAVNPSGRLPIAFAASESDLPELDNTSLEVTYGYFHGYRHLDRHDTEPLFPFGFGLSYTTFEYSNLQLDRTTASPDDVVQVSFDVTNTGTVAGIETAQLYVGAPDSAIDRAVRDLRAFGQVELDPGESETLTLDVPVRDLAFYDVERSAWVVEPTTYRVEVGSSSRSLPLSATFGVSDR